jgi:hypothetical protein
MSTVAGTQLRVALGVLTAALVAACGSGESSDHAPVPATLELSTSGPLSFTGTVGGANPAQQSFTVSSSGGGTLAAPRITITYGGGAFNWHTATVGGVAAPYTVTLQCATGGMVAGTYTATVSVASPGASSSPRTVNVTMTLTPAGPALAASVASVAFTSRSFPDADPASRAFTISNGGGGTLAPPAVEIEFPDATDWLDGTVTGSAAPYTVTLQPTIATLGLPAGTYTATLRISSPGASNTLAIPVTLTLTTSWTVLVYGHGDHTLSESLLADIQEMNQAVLGDSVTVVVAADYSAGRAMPDGSPFPVGTVVYEIAGSGAPAAEVATGVEEDFDDPAVLTAWTQSVLEAYPADRYGLVLWDHGGSWEGGFGGDEQDVLDQPGTPMLPGVVADAVSAGLSAAGLAGPRPLEFLAFDTCLMMGNEVAYEFRDVADVYLAAAEVDFGRGWDYAASLGILGASPAISPTAFATAEVDAWDAHHATAGLEDQLIRAHSAIDLAQLGAYATAWQDLASTTAQSASVDWLELARLQFGAAPGYSSASVLDLNPQPHLRDAGQLLAALGGLASDANVAAAATSAASALDALVIHASLGVARSDAGQAGMHVEAPPGSAWLAKAAAYSSLDWEVATGWSGVLDGLSAASDAIAPAITTIVQNAGDVTPATPAIVTLSSDDADLAFARVYLAETIGGNVIEYGIVGEGAAAPATAYEFTWPAAQPSLGNGTDLSEIYVAPWMTAGTTTLYLIPGHVGAASVHAIYEDGAATVDTVLVETAGGLAVLPLDAFGGLSFVPVVLDSTNGVWLDATPLAIPDVPGASLDLAWAQVGPGTYHLVTAMSDVWGNVGDVLDSVTVN